MVWKGSESWGCGDGNSAHTGKRRGAQLESHLNGEMPSSQGVVLIPLSIVGRS